MKKVICDRCGKDAKEIPIEVFSARGPKNPGAWTNPMEFIIQVTFVPIEEGQPNAGKIPDLCDECVRTIIREHAEKPPVASSSTDFDIPF